MIPVVVVPHPHLSRTGALLTITAHSAEPRQLDHQSFPFYAARGRIKLLSWLTSNNVWLPSRNLAVLTRILLLHSRTVGAEYLLQVPLQQWCE